MLRGFNNRKAFKGMLWLYSGNMTKIPVPVDMIYSHGDSAELGDLIHDVSEVRDINGIRLNYFIKLGELSAAIGAYDGVREDQIGKGWGDMTFAFQDIKSRQDDAPTRMEALYRFMSNLYETTIVSAVKAICGNCEINQGLDGVDDDESWMQIELPWPRESTLSAIPSRLDLMDGSVVYLESMHIDYASEPADRRRSVSPEYELYLILKENKNSFYVHGFPDEKSGEDLCFEPDDLVGILQKYGLEAKIKTPHPIWVNNRNTGPPLLTTEIG